MIPKARHLLLVAAVAVLGALLASSPSLAQVDLSVSKTGDGFSKAGDNVDWTITITNNNTTEAVTLPSIVDTMLGDITGQGTCGVPLAPLASCTITVSRMTLDTDPDPLVNVVAALGVDQFGNAALAQDDHRVDLIHPNFTVAKDCLPDTPVPPGTVVSFRIDTVNTGDAELVLTSVNDTELGELLTGEVDLNERAGAPCTEADFDTGATTGCFRIEESYTVGSEDVTNTVTVIAKLNDRFDLPNTLSESDTATCEVEEGQFTRTWGFWKTHGSDGQFDPPVEYGYTCYVAETNVGFPILLGWTQLNDCEDVFGMFWENKAQCSRTEQTQIQGSRQFLAALLNFGAFGTPVPDDCKSKHYADLSTTELFDAMREALADGNRRRINELGGILACYNESGDDQAIMDGVPVPHADPNGTQAIADFDLVTCGK